MKKEERGFMVLDWMVSRLGLKGNQLLCYAFLRRVTEDGAKPYLGGYNGVAAAIGCTVPTAYGVLMNLKEMKLLDYDKVSELRFIKVDE